MLFTMQNHTIPVAALADKYGFDECKRDVEYYYVQLAASAIRADQLQFSRRADVDMIIMPIATGATVWVNAYVLENLCRLNMRFAATALAPLYVRLLADAMRGDIQACVHYNTQASAVKALGAYVLKVLNALAEEPAPLAKAVHHQLSTLLLSALTEVPE